MNTYSDSTPQVHDEVLSLKATGGELRLVADGFNDGGADMVFVGTQSGGVSLTIQQAREFCRALGELIDDIAWTVLYFAVDADGEWWVYNEQADGWFCCDIDDHADVVRDARHRRPGATIFRGFDEGIVKMERNFGELLR